jgi:hypothetical protein
MNSLDRMQACCGIRPVVKRAAGVCSHLAGVANTIDLLGNLGLPGLEAVLVLDLEHRGL